MDWVSDAIAAAGACIAAISLGVSLRVRRNQQREQEAARVRGVVVSVQEAEPNRFALHFSNTSPEPAYGCKAIFTVGAGEDLWEWARSVGVLAVGATSVVALPVPAQYGHLVRDGRFSLGWEFRDTAGRRWQRPSQRGQYGRNDPILVDPQYAKLARGWRRGPGKVRSAKRSMKAASTQDPLLKALIESPELLEELPPELRSHYGPLLEGRK